MWRFSDLQCADLNFFVKKQFEKAVFSTVLSQSCAVFRRILRINQENLRICVLWTDTTNKFADLRQRNEPKDLRFAD